MLAHSPIQWGDVPGWIGGVLTGVAALVAALAYKSELGKRDAEREDAKAEQAHTVDAWLNYFSWNRGSMQEEQQGLIFADLNFVLANTSLNRVSNFSLTVEPPNGAPFVHRVDVVPPGEKTETFRIPMDNMPQDDDTGQRWRSGLTYSIQFTDSAGLRWIREFSGKLSRVYP